MRYTLAKLMFNSLLLILLVVLSVPVVQAQDGGRGDKGTPQLGNRLFGDDFATFVNRWETAETSAYTIAYETQGLHVELLEAEAEILTQPSSPLLIENFLMSTSIEFLAESSPDALAGIAFGYQNPNNYYVFAVRATGHYEVRLKQAGEWTNMPLVRGYYPDLATADDAVITLTILYDAGYFELSINATPLVPFFNDELTAGEFGLYAFAPTEAAHIVFDDFSVFDLVYASDPVDDAEVNPPPTTDPDANPDTPDPANENIENTEDDTPSEDVELVKPPRI